MSTVAVRQMPSSIFSVASLMKKSLECSTKPRPVSTGPPFSTFIGLGVFLQLDLVGGLDDVELHQQAREIDAAGRMIDDDAHGAFGGMRAHIDHRALETRIAHHRHGDQQLAVEIAIVRANCGPCRPCGGTRASVSCLQGAFAKALSC